MNMDLHEEKSQREVMTESSNASRIRSTKRGTECSSSEMEKKLKLTFKDQKMHHLIFQEGGLADGTEVAYYSRGMKLLEGKKQGRGILCSCCKIEVSPSQFEAHAGMASRKKPYDHIFLSDGMSLHEYAFSLKLNCENQTKTNDDLCQLCAKGGDLLPCKGCPRSFHKECVDEDINPFEKWFCKSCLKSLKCVGPNAKAKRRIWITDNRDNRDLVACVLCRSCDFSEDGFNDRTVIVCEQCEKEFHIGCLRKDKSIILKKLPPGSWFCTLDCERLHGVLNVLETFEPKPVPESLMDLISVEDGITDCDVKWFHLRGKDASEENRLLLTQAVEIFHDRFNPILDSVTGSDFIPSMAYGLQMGASDFSGVHCAMIIINSKVVTAGMFRVFGHEIAELSIVATSQANQRKGYFQLLFSCFEGLLSYLEVKKLVIPAAEDSEEMWTNKFGFRKVTSVDLKEYQQTHTSMIAFRDTSLLEKEVPKVHNTFKNDDFFKKLIQRNNGVASSSVDPQDSANEFIIEKENMNLRRHVTNLESELAHVKNELEAIKFKLEKSESEKADLEFEVQVLQMFRN